MPTPPDQALPAFPDADFDRLLPIAFAEDLGANGDITSNATLAAEARGQARLLCKQAGVIAGLPCIDRVFSHHGARVEIEMLRGEGEEVGAGDELARLRGPLRALLSCERILLNFLQRFSGIATTARAYAHALDGSDTRVLDTRKTLPGYRALDKYAVTLGGGRNHRMGLYDMVLVKDNHADACGSVRAAVDKVEEAYSGKYPVEAEVRSLSELESLLDARVDVILLDNMDDAALAACVGMARSRAPRLKLEASGNMDLDRARRIKGLGLDFISVGALTHSVRALDISLEIVGENG